MATAKKLPSGSWRVLIYTGKDGTGKRQYKSFTASTKKAAEYAAAEFAAKKKSPSDSLTVGEAIDRYIASKDGILSPSTISSYKMKRRNRLQSLMSIRLDKLTREDVQKAVNDDAKRMSAKSVIDSHGLLSSALKMFAPDFVLRTTLPRKVKKLKHDLPTSNEVMQIVSGDEIELPALLALCLCLRVSEVRGLKKSDIDGDCVLIQRIIVTVDGKHIEKELAKTDATRRIEKLPPFLKDMMLAVDGEYITNLSGQALYKRFTRRMDKAGFPNIRFHDLRHISASDMHAQGLSDRVASERGGWAGTQTMRQVYQHSFAPDRVSADEKMIAFYEGIHKDATQNATQKENTDEK